MAFPASGGAVPLTLAVAWDLSRSVARELKDLSTSTVTQINAGPVSAQAILRVASSLSSANTALTQYSAVPGIAAYAQEQVNDATLDVPAAFTAMKSAVVTALTWIVTNFPKDGSGNVLGQTFSAAGMPQWNTFTSAQLAGLVTVLNALAATIN